MQILIIVQGWNELMYEMKWGNWGLEQRQELGMIE